MPVSRIYAAAPHAHVPLLLNIPASVPMQEAIRRTGGVLISAVSILTRVRPWLGSQDKRIT